MSQSLLIDTETLQQNLGREGLVVVDVRGKAAYAYGGHIPGAVNATWHEFSDPQAIAKGVLDPDLSRLEMKVRSLGINLDSDVVIYSNPFDNWGDEGRMFWMLEYLGHEKLRILDGGWVKWVEEKRPFEHGTANPKPGDFRAMPKPDLIIMKEDLKRVVRQSPPGATIADARSLEEYVGKEVSGIPRPGHIPFAINIPWNVFLNPDATVKGADAIETSLDEQGLDRDKDREIICYCTGGVRSAWLYFILKHQGYKRVRNYPGSWWEWSRDFAAPVEKDAKLLQKIIDEEPTRPS